MEIHVEVHFPSFFNFFANDNSSIAIQQTLVVIPKIDFKKMYDK